MPVSREEVIEKVGAYVARTFGGTSIESYRKAFDASDTNRDGRLSTEEVAEILARAGVGFRLTRWPVAKAVVEALDANRNGYVEFAEFEAVFRPRTRPPG